MALAEHHDMIDAFPTDRADQPFCVCVLPWRTSCRRLIPNAHGSQASGEYLAISSIAIPDHIARDLLPAKSLGQLIGDPFGCGVRGDPKPQDLPPAMSHNQQAIEQPERDCRHHEQVHRGDPVSMITKERFPSLRGRRPPPCHIFGHASLTDIDAQLEQFTVNPRRSPSLVLDAHLTDQVANFQWHDWATAAASRLPAPVQSETCPMPTDHGVWPHYRQGIIGIGEQSADARQYQSINRDEGRLSGASPPKYIDLLPQHQQFSFKRSSRPKKVADYQTNEPE